MAGLMSAERGFRRHKPQQSWRRTGREGPADRFFGVEGKNPRRLADRKVALATSILLPEGYEEQGRFNMLLLTAGNVLLDMVIGDSHSGTTSSRLVSSTRWR